MNWNKKRLHDLFDLDQLLASKRQALELKWSQLGPQQLSFEKLNYENEYARVRDLMNVEAKYNVYLYEYSARFTGIIQEMIWLNDYILNNDINMDVYNEISSEHESVFPFDFQDVIGNYIETGEVDPNLITGFEEFIVHIATDIMRLEEDFEKEFNDEIPDETEDEEEPPIE